MRRWHMSIINNIEKGEKRCTDIYSHIFRVNFVQDHEGVENELLIIILNLFNTT